MRRTLRDFNDKKIKKEDLVGLIVLFFLLLLILLSGCAYPSYLKTDDPRWTDYIDKHDIRELKGGK